MYMYTIFIDLIRMLRLVSAIWTTQSKHVTNICLSSGRYLHKLNLCPKMMLNIRTHCQNSQGTNILYQTTEHIEMDYTNIREDSLKIFNAAVESVSPGKMIRNAVRVSDDGNYLAVDERDYHMSTNVYVVGFGKAVLGMARTLEAVIGRHIVEGVLSVPRGSQKPFATPGKLEQSRIRVLEGTQHNLPDGDAHKAAMSIMDLVQRLRETDLLIVLITGGGSALLPSPVPPISLEDEMELTRVMSTHGATIGQLNTVRQNVEALKGGGLAQLAHPAQVISLILSDVVGDRLDMISSGPTAPRQTSPTQCLQVLHHLGVADSVPRVIVETLEAMAAIEHEIQTSSYDHVHNVIVGSNCIATAAASDMAQSLDYVPLVLTNTLQGEASLVASMFIRLVQYIVYCSQFHGNAVPQSEFDWTTTETRLHSDGLSKSKLDDVCDVSKNAFGSGRGVCVICGGETTVNVKGTGKGGRNQEMALAFAVEYNKLVQDSGNQFLSKYCTVFLSAGTDGQDGPTDAAGAVVGRDLVAHAVAAGVNVEEYLENNDSYTVFKLLSDRDCLIQTGLTGTNVMDVQVLIVRPMT